MSWDVSDSLTIRSLTGYRDLEILLPGLQRIVQLQRGRTAPFLFRSASTADDIDMDQFSQELQFIGSAFDDKVTYTPTSTISARTARDEGGVRADPGVRVSRVTADTSRRVKVAGDLRAVTWTPQSSTTGSISRSVRTHEDDRATRTTCACRLQGQSR